MKPTRGSGKSRTSISAALRTSLARSYLRDLAGGLGEAPARAALKRALELIVLEMRSQAPLDVLRFAATNTACGGRAAAAARSHEELERLAPMGARLLVARALTRPAKTRAGALAIELLLALCRDDGSDDPPARRVARLSRTS